mgnify:CR=1 FL=1
MYMSDSESNRVRNETGRNHVRDAKTASMLRLMVRPLSSSLRQPHLAHKLTDHARRKYGVRVAVSCGRLQRGHVQEGPEIRSGFQARVRAGKNNRARTRGWRLPGGGGRRRSCCCCCWVRACMPFSMPATLVFVSYRSIHFSFPLFSCLFVIPVSDMRLDMYPGVRPQQPRRPWAAQHALCTSRMLMASACSR